MPANAGILRLLRRPGAPTQAEFRQRGLKLRGVSELADDRDAAVLGETRRERPSSFARNEDGKVGKVGSHLDRQRFPSLVRQSVVD
jgi:hypothetical protein